MSIDNRARDLALGIAAALDSGVDVTEAKLAIVSHLLGSPDETVRAERLLAFVNANAAMVAILMDVAQTWYQVGWQRGHGFGLTGDPAFDPPPPGSDLLVKQLAEVWPEGRGEAK